MSRVSAFLAALCFAFGARAIGLGESQAGEPMAVNVDYTVPAYGVRDVQSLAQRGASSTAQVHAKSLQSPRVLLGDAPFAALSESGTGRGDWGFLYVCGLVIGPFLLLAVLHCLVCVVCRWWIVAGTFPVHV